MQMCHSLRCKLLAENMAVWVSVSKNCYKSKSRSGIVFTGLLIVARGFFFLAKEFDGFPLAFSPCRVQGKPKVACFCIVLFYVHIKILVVLVPVI